MSGAELLARTGSLEQRAEQFYTSRRVVLLDEMKSVCRRQRREANAELQRHQRQRQRQSQEHFQEVVQSQQVASGEVENWRHELSQSLVKGAHCQTLYVTSRSGASESSSEIHQVRHEREHKDVEMQSFLLKRKLRIILD